MADSEDHNQNAGDQAPSLAEVMKQGREERIKKEELEKQEQLQQQQQPGQEEGSPVTESSETDEEEYNMMIAGLSEVALLMKKPEPVNGTGFLYDERFAVPKNDWDPLYPENPTRVTSSYKRCCDLGLVSRCTCIEAQYGTEDQVLMQHTQKMIDILQSTVNMSMEDRMELAKKYDSIYFHPETFQTALLSMGSTVELMEQILKKKVRNGFVFARPPGHHAMTEEFCGFCYFNNVAIAAKHALDNLGLKRILIVDWDVHHGQATQQMFYNDPRVLYFSIHRYEFGRFWPNLRESDYDYIGEGEGTGFNINVPLNETGCGDSEYLAIFQQVLMPIAYEYNPDLVLISAGYDAAIGCPEGLMRVTPATYANFVHMLSALAEGRVCTVLEGGYNIKSLSEGVALSVRSLLGDPCPLLKPTTEPKQSVVESILDVIKCLKPYWKCLQYQPELDEGELCECDGLNTDPPKEGVTFMCPETRPAEFPIIYEFADKQEADDARNKLNSVIDELIAETSLTVPPHRTCLVYDTEMKAHRALGMPGHPEKPERISRIYDKHKDWGLLDRCLQLKSRLAEHEDLELIHSAKHVEFIKDLEGKEVLALRQLQGAFNSIYLSKETYMCARIATGCTLEVVDTVLSGKARNGVAIVRPPGHHAECDKPMGFCFFNSVAIAAKYAQKKYGVKKILIVDWDVHHGNGTQHAFYEDPSVLFISLHRYDGGFFYPASNDGNFNMVGRDAGEGFNVNIPWHYGGKGDAEYLAAFQQIVMPIAYEYAPDLVLVSAGFDAAIGDPLGGCKVTPAGYGHMTHMLSGLANGRVILVLEGGYNLVSMANSMATCTSVLLGDPVPQWRYEEPQQVAVMTICDVLDAHKKYWKSLKFRGEDFLKHVAGLFDLNLGRPLQTFPIAIPVKEKAGGESGNTQQSSPSTTGQEAQAKGDITNLSDQLKTVTVSDSEEKTQSTEEITEEPMAEQGSSQGADGGSDKFESNKHLLKHYEEQGVEAMYAVEPLKWCEHLDQVGPVPEGGLNVNDPCEDCQATGENWVCLVCYKVYCSRYVKEHMVKHGQDADHPVVLSYADLSVWCYKCDNYLDNEVLTPAKQSAHKSKFGTDL